MLKKISFLAFLLLTVSALWAQPHVEFGTISGTVTMSDGSPAVGALVSVPWGIRPGFPRYTHTDETGAYSIDSIYAGSHWIGAFLVNLETWQLVDVPANDVLVVNLSFEGTLDEVGAVAGNVVFANGEVAAGAFVRLDGERGDPQHGHHGVHLETIADATGNFGFAMVPVGICEVTASVPMHGFAEANIEVVANQTTNITLTIQDHDTGGHGHHHGDSLTIVELAGTAIVLESDSMHHMTRYFLDVDGDGTADYRLSFGPPWYNPPSGAQRPVNGDQITIQGGLFTYTDPPMVVVYQINGLFWRQPGHGHGGHGGGDHHHNGCNPDSVVRVQLVGSAIVQTHGGMHGDVTLYLMDTDANGEPDYVLDFGRSDYDPGSGAQRPENGDQINIVGGQIYCPNPMERTIVIVYEINGLFWREPGDTLGLGAETPDAVDEPVYLGSPTTYLTARNFPNPFNPTTTISYSIPAAGDVRVTVFDVTGREVAELVNTHQNAGSYAVQWNGTNLASGLYFYRVNAGGLNFTNRMVLMK